jgi:hypothetical protein
LKDIETNVPLAPRAKKTQAHAPTAADTLGLGSFYAEGRSTIDARKGHLSRVGIGPQEQPPAMAGTHEIPTQAKMLAMPDSDAGVDMPRLVGDALPEGDATLYKPKRIPKDAVNLEA